MRETKEWTLMFYLASDNPLAPSVVTQLKALKSAGFHPDANVVTQFDPFVEGTPTHIFEVNLANKIKRPGVADVGFQGNDPFVRNLVEDKLWREQKTRQGKSLKRELRRILKQNHGLQYEAPTPPAERTNIRQLAGEDPEEPDPRDSLRNFLNFCRNQYPAKHFALFILGHGVVVGNDIFLYDEHASKHSLSLTELGDVLTEFKTEIDDAEFELLSFHSCSVSSLEVAFELKGTANYMLASQGTAFVGSWPYRSILIRIFNDLVRFGSHINVKRILSKIFKLCFFNAVDFLLAGYSFQLTLCNLQRVQCLHDAIAELVEALLAALADPLTKDVAKDAILLSHLQSQSFYQEMYTDLYDFCFCLSNKISDLETRPCACANPTASCHCVPPRLRALKNKCEVVMDMLVKENPARRGDPEIEQIIVSAEFLGPEYQYSRGVSVYFPWTEPTGDRRILSEYVQYRFHLDFAEKNEPSWLTFLNQYFKDTLRAPSSDEPDHRRFLPTLCPHQAPGHAQPPLPDPCAQSPVQQPAPPEPTQCEKEQQERELREDIANLIYADGSPYASYGLGQGKIGSGDPAGGDCDCPPLKNYPRDTRPRRERSEEATPEPQFEFTQAKFLAS